ncbi:hypothetical protein [Pseudofrankia saprophytica]|uniref:hypothetical protein n=1 Tax=Pseudofrankia saprophytica TaxID=298655 RepID=UPI000234D008|nr:hypothetical protein [Pseudofrankia saprophytica]
MSGDEGAVSPACPVCGRTDAYPVTHGLRSDRSVGLQQDGTWASGSCFGGPEQWRCRGCRCEWPTRGFRFHLFVDVRAWDHETAQDTLARMLYASPPVEDVDVDPVEIGDAVGYVGVDDEGFPRWSWD